MSPDRDFNKGLTPQKSSRRAFLRLLYDLGVGAGVVGWVAYLISPLEWII